MKFILALTALLLALFVSENLCSIPDFDNIEHFQTLTLTYEVYKQWPQLRVLEKLPYLIDRAYLSNVKADFLVSAESLVPDGSKAIAKMVLQQKLQDFITETQFHTFFSYCDINNDDLLDWVEYVLCRGSYDLSGNPHDVSEFDYLENIVISDFRERLNDPYDPMVLELIEKGEL
eukprot:gene34893-42254_t